MNIIKLESPIARDLSDALKQFELKFKYPLGASSTFVISHGENYPDFFRSMGEACTFIAVLGDLVIGSISAAIRKLATPDGNIKPVVYLGDLKIVATHQNGTVLYRLAQHVMRWVGSRADSAYAVVMDGTIATPTDYTGRAGLPPFQEVGKVAILRVPVHVTNQKHTVSDDARGSELDEICKSFLVNRYVALGGEPAMRSLSQPYWIATKQRTGCALIEDTRRVKRLFADNGSELSSAHLSNIAYKDPKAGAELILQGLAEASALGFPALFAAIPMVEVGPILDCLQRPDITIASATIYGVGLKPHPLWNINTSEI